MITPTGAAIVAALANTFTLPPKFTIDKIGVGAGKKEFAHPNVVRAMLISEIIDTHGDEICILKSAIDDSTPEQLAYCHTRLLELGAADVYFTPIYMKKNRPAYKLSILCKIQDRKSMEKLVFVHTTAIGIRYYLVNRSKMIREIKNVSTVYGIAKVKFCTWEGECYCYPESDSVAELARKNKKSFSELYHEIKLEAEKTM